MLDGLRESLVPAFAKLKIDLNKKYSIYTLVRGEGMEDFSASHTSRPIGPLKTPPYMTLRRAVIVLVLVSILVPVTDFLYIGAMPLGNPSSLVKIHDISYPCDTLSGTGRRLSIRIEKGKAWVRFRLTLPPGHPCIQGAFGGSLLRNLARFVTASFGSVKIGRAFLTDENFEAPKLTHTKNGHVLVELIASRPIGRFSSIELDSNDDVDVAWEGVSISNIYPEPYHKAASKMEFSQLLPGSPTSSRGAPRHIYFYVSPARGSHWAIERKQTLLQRLGASFNVPFFSYLLYGTTLALPLLLFLKRFHKTETDHLILLLYNATTALLIFHFLLFLFESLSAPTSKAIWFSRLSYHVEDWLERFRIVRVYPLLGQGFTDLKITAIGVLAPALMIMKLRRAREQLTIAPAQIAFATLFGGCLVYGASYVQARGAAPGWSVTLIVLATGGILLWSLLEMLCRTLADSQPNPALAPTAALVTVVLIASDLLLITQEGARDWFWLAVSALFGAVLLKALIAIIRRLSRHLPMLSNLWRKRLSRRNSVVLLVALSLPVGGIIFPTENLATSHSLASFGLAVDRFVPLIWLLGITAVLFRRGRNSLEITSWTRWAGIICASSVLYSVASMWLYIPVTFLIGWFVLDRLLIRPAKDWESLKELVEPSVVRARPRLLSAILILNAAEHAYRRFRRKQIEKVIEGELNIQTFEQQREIRQRQLDSLRSKAILAGRTGKEVALAFGPKPTAWLNGVHGAKFAVLFAMPWIVLGIAEFLRAPTTYADYPLWELTNTVSLVLLRWVSFGFLLGYFFPYIQGKSGLEKGFALFLASVLPALPLAAVYNGTVKEWTPILFWFLQVFIHCMLLGLFAFDYTVLQQGGHRDWRLLFEVHEVPALGASISSILLAIGTAMTTLLVSGGTELIGLALKFALPQLGINLPGGDTGSN